MSTTIPQEGVVTFGGVARDGRVPAVVVAPSTALATPATDPVCLWEFGVHGLPMHQYVKWADATGMIAALADAGLSTAADVAARTPLTTRGADALLGVLTVLGLVRRQGDRFFLDAVAGEYLDRRSPFYMGGPLYGLLKAPIPAPMLKGGAVRHYSEFTGTLRDWIRYWRMPNQFGRREALATQHARNFPVAIVAARTGLFDGVRHLADIGGGSGAFAIPLALDDPSRRITLVELPRALPKIRPYLERHGVQDRVTLAGFNVHRTPWPLTGCDAVLLGNFMHFCSDAECVDLLRESYRMLPPGGRLFLHEMLWQDDMSGPLLTALWSFWMAAFCAGRQRSAKEFAELLEAAGFPTPAVVPTAGGFSLLATTKPHVG